MASRKRSLANDEAEERPSKRQCLVSLDTEEKRRWKQCGACGRCITRGVRLKKGVCQRLRCYQRAYNERERLKKTAALGTLSGDDDDDGVLLPVGECGEASAGEQCRTPHPRILVTARRS